VEFESLVVSREGEDLGPVAWRFCTSPRAADEATGVSARCLLGYDLQLTPNPGIVPPDACARFGPNAPPAQGDGPQQRPVDPDRTGGYHLPVQASLAPGSLVREGPRADQVAFGFQRIRCDLSGATRDVFDDFEARYELNQNPEIARVEATGPALIGARGGLEWTVAPGSTVELSAVISADSQEPYVVYRREHNRLEDRREMVLVHWYITGGALAGSEQKFSPDQMAEEGLPRASTRWTAPLDSTEVTGFAVILDERGGAAWRGFRLSVKEEDG